jgi:hypothetical protein
MRLGSQPKREIGMTRAELYAFISRHKLGVLGYLSPVGTPQSALVGIAVTPELEIIFDTVNSSRKYSALLRNPAASFAIGWTGEVTVQYEGFAFQPGGEELARYRRPISRPGRSAELT